MAVVTGAVLAAGSGTRMGGPKAELVVDGERLVDRAVRVLREGGCEEVIAVVRAGLSVLPARAVVNPMPERGMRSSLAVLLDVLEAGGSADPGRAAALAVILVDTPAVSGDAVRAVVRRWRPGRIAVARYAGRRGHPTVMTPALWREALALAAPDEGARTFLCSRPDLVDEIAVPGSADDLDTPTDLARWQSR